MTTEVRYFDVKETAAEMRKALRAAFPGVKFSVTMGRGTGYGWIDVRWTDGPTEDAVREIMYRFQHSQFDGMDDAYHRIEPTLYAREDGSLYEPHYSCRGVNTHRYYSTQARAWAAHEYATNGHNYYRECQVLQTADFTSGVPAIEILHYRPTDSDCNLRVWIDGQEVETTSLVDVDPGRGYTRRDWLESRDIAAATAATPEFAQAIRAAYDDGATSEYIQDDNDAGPDPGNHDELHDRLVDRLGYDPRD